MNAAADYAAAKAMLTRALPAYVSYDVHSHVKLDAFVRNETSNVVVRTSDGVIVKGKVPEAAAGGLHISGNTYSAMEPVARPAFKVRCYEAAGARMRLYGGRNLEAISLRSLCRKGSGAKGFDTLYVDPRSREPIAAAGSDIDEPVRLSVVEQFSRVKGHALPSSFRLRIQGSGFMVWLDLLIDQRYDNFGFPATASLDLEKQHGT